MLKGPGENTASLLRQAVYSNSRHADMTFEHKDSGE